MAILATHTHRAAGVMAAIVMALAVSACVIEPARARVVGGFIVTAPPAAVVEQRGIAPAPGYIWFDGYWNWAGGRHVWMPGHWAAPRAGYVWVPHHWEQTNRGWHLNEGHWVRARR